MANLNTFLAAKSPIRSSQLRSLHLHDWWLIKVEGDFNGCWRLGVGGFSFREKLGIRVLCSSAITKRHNHVTLETADGITVTLSGLINRSRTQEKGFPPEVCSYFLYGFPYNWKEYADQSSCEESIKNISENDGTRITLPISFDDLPVTRVRELLMTTTGPDYCAITETIFNDILGMCLNDSSSSPCEPSVNLDAITETIFNDILGMCVNDSSSSPCEPSVNLDEENTYQETPRIRGRPKKIKNPPKTPNQSKVGVEVEGLSSNARRVATRSMTRARNLKKNEFENPPPTTFIKCSLAISVLESRGSADNNGVVSEKPSEPMSAPLRRKLARNTRRSNRPKCPEVSSVTGQESKDN